MFGDSIVDTGNNNYLETIVKVNYPPYGKDFMGGKPTGRFCDGKVPSDLFVEELGIKELLPAYLDPTLQNQDLASGVNFASGGAGYDPLTSELASVISLSDQLELFKEYIVKLKGIVGEERTSNVLASSLYMVVAGSNDILNTYFGGPLRKPHYDVPSYTDLMVSSASTVVQDLYKLGARRIGVFGLPPIGCVPSQRTFAGGEQRNCAEKYNEAAQIFNTKLSAELNSLNSNLLNARMVYIDVYSLPLDVIYNPKNYGFKISNKGCCGTGISTTMHFLLIQLSSSSTTLSCVFLFLLLWIAQALINLPHNETIPAVIIFGDSIVDTGNNNNIQTIAKSNYSPYGKDFMGGKPTGRFSNGKVPSDLFVEELGIKELLPAYLDPNLQTEDLTTGVTFASGAAGYDPLTSELASVISLSDQLEMFEEYIEKLKEVVGEERTSTILTNSMYTVVAGSNDIINTYFTALLRKLQYDFPSYADLLVSYASTFVQELYNLGARRIGVLGVPPLGCLPSQRTLAGGMQRECAEEYNEAAQILNAKLSTELDSLNCNFPDATIVYIDIYNLPLDLIYNPEKYGFKIADEGCCGTGTIEVAYLCSYSCKDVSEYVFWDSFHFTEKAYRLLVHQMLKKNMDKFFCDDSNC
ncbi:hypothetical protein F0562_027100 [Nyssa sinensis]|uniref:SGNH hydrolase-type esterase domain-containing protein n=1 Tax=Nyssa sinensis TaxID=561372 RepID=A0A5J5B6L6_9ASTE|nr:hypothetical protein F0562_027100 [Nyssa sinensis]